MFKAGLDNLYEPYRTVVGKLLEELLRVFNGRLVSVVVYGSVARGDAKRNSDIDILIIVEDLPASRFERLREYLKAEEELDPLLIELMEKGYFITLSPILKSRKEAEYISPIYLDMVEDAVIVFDRDKFFHGILSRLWNKLNELGAERVWVGKKWYWRLKKTFKFGEVIEL